MKPLTATILAEACGGRLAAGRPEAVASAVSTDTRSIATGSAFVALKGERFDGNAYAADAFKAGASVVMVERWEGTVPDDRAVIVVEDGLIALQRLARWYRLQRVMPVVGITGSNGKTSTKDFTASVLRRKFQVAATKGNLNNHIGVPLTVLSIEDGDTAAVVEMGMNHSGEIAPLCEIARPNLGIITNIGTAHIEHLGSREAIAEEKGQLGRSLPEDAVLFVPAGCDFFDYFRARCRCRVIPVGNGRGMIRAEEMRQEGARTRFTLVIEDRAVAEVDLPVTGRHMVKNALLAAGCGWHLGMDPQAIADGLSSTTLTSGRLRRFECGGVTVFDDTYNANPESMAAAIETLAETPVPAGAKRMVVLGRMGELGPFAAEGHLKVGRLARQRGLAVIAVGEGAEGIAEGAGGADFFPDPEEAAREVAARAKAGDAVLFKASRSAALERVMKAAFPTED